MSARSSILKVGIASPKVIRERTLAIARGERRRGADEPRIWFTSIHSLAQVLSEPNRLLLEMIRSAKPETLSELAEMSGRKVSNLSRTLKTMENYRLVRLEKHEQTVRPIVDWDKVDIEVPLQADAA
jgi:predicted transcriptional regulator